MGRLDGKIALVTGGGRGIGRGIVDKFLAEGARVVIAQRGAPECGEAVFQATDLARPGDIERLFATVGEQFGGLDVLVNNAGVMCEATVEEMAVSDWDRLLAINLTAPFLAIKHAIALMRARGGGSIVNIGSIEGLAANPKHPAYCASKAGIHGLTAAVAIDHGPDNIRCNAIAPGWIRSDLSERYVESMANSAQVRADLTSLHPVGRLGEPADIGAMAAWLASDEAGFVTGQVFVVDGGRLKKIPLPAR